MDYIAFGRELRKMRQQRRLTQEKLAELVDLSVPYISHLERGTKKPSMEVLVRLADFGRHSRSAAQRQSGDGQRRILSRGPGTFGRLLYRGTCGSD